MTRKQIYMLLISAAMLVLSNCTSTTPPQQPSWSLKDMVAPIQKSVVTVATFDLEGDLTNIGSGFFIDAGGTLVTNYHVLDGAYSAEIKLSDGSKYAIISIVAKDQVVDLIKVRVDIPQNLSVPVKLAKIEPGIAERVVVIGSPMGLDQTISEGIISAVRNLPIASRVYQLTAPISPGSSGSPALNLQGEVIGVVTFQTSKGQNLNFAISAKALEMMTNETNELSLAEWTIKKSGSDPEVAAALCREGAQLTIKGKYQAALTYYQKATQANPEDPDTWHGLGSCYIGLNQPDNAIDAYHQSIAVNPDNAASHFVLAMYYKVLEQYKEAIPSLLQVIHIDPENVQARFELAGVYAHLNRTEEQIDSYKHILKLRPDHVPTLHLMGRTVGQMGRYDEALDFLNKASELEPDNARIHFDLGVTYHLIDSPKEELRAYTRAIRANPRMTEAHYNMAVLFLKQGKRHLALHEYDILKSLDTDVADQLFELIYPHNMETRSSPETVTY